MSSYKAKSWLGTNLLLLFVVLIICLIAAEIALRIGWRGFSPNPGNIIMAYDDTLGWVAKADKDLILSEGGIEVPCVTNRWGFRDDQPLSVEETKGKRRLMFLGDSFIMGTGLPREARVSELLENRDEMLISYNFGIFGYSTDQELLVLKKYGPVVQPHDVLLFFCANDLIYNDSDLGHRVPKSHFRVNDDGSLILGNVPVPKLPEPNPVLKWAEDHLAIAQIVSKVSARLAFRRESGRRRPTGRDLGLEGAEKREADLDSLLLFSSTSNISDLTYYLLKEIKSECEMLGARLLLFTTPSNHHWTATRDETPAEIQRVLNWCDDLGIEAVNLFPAFYRDYAEHGETLYLPDKMHWNERGNQVTTEVIYSLLGATETQESDEAN